MVNGQQSFVRYELTITRAVYEANLAAGRYPQLDRVKFPALTIREEDVPTYSDLKQLLEKVGKPYGWEKRREYHQSPMKEEIAQRIEDPSSRYFRFWSGKTEVGGVIVANVEQDLKSLFQIASKLPHNKDLTPEAAENTVEIYKIGLKPEYTGLKWGPHFVGELLKELFDNSAKTPDVVYLNTRSTNHDGVLSFYRNLGLDVIHASTHPDDLLSDEAIHQLSLPKPVGKKTKTPPPVLDPSIPSLARA